MVQLAIIGHKTRGKEVIEILEMLGGENKEGYCGYNPNVAYYISHQNTIVCDCDCDCYTLEEFLKKFPYKVGDKVIYADKRREITKMVWDGKTDTVAYKLDDKLYCNVINELQPYEETMENLTIQDIRDNNAEWLLNKLQEMSVKKVLQTISDLYDKLRKPQYPKTYAECCDVLSISPYYNLRYHTYERCYNEYATADKLCSLQDKLNILGKLLICRDAYWKIAGEQMGLDKPWKPDWNDSVNIKWIIGGYKNKIVDDCNYYIHNILAFPTKEMSDAFFENFKELIESCRELL